MKTLALLSLSLAVALGLPPFVQDAAQNHPDLTKEEQSPLLGDLLPAQGHVVVDDPAPQVRLGSKDQQEKVDQVKVEPEVKPELEVKVEPEVKPELLVKEEPEVKVEPEVKPELEVKEEPEVKPEPEVKEEPEVKPELEVKVEPEVKPEPEVKEEPEVKPELEVKEEPEVKPELEVKEEPEVKPELEVKVEPEVKPELEVKEEPEVEPEPQLEDVPNFMAVSDETEPEMNPEDEAVREVEEKFKVQMNLEPETETGQQFVERHVDMERTHEVMVEPIMELEPLDDDNNMLGNDVELPEKQRNFEEPIMELEPETRKEEVIPEAAVMEEGPALDINGEPMPRLEEYFPNEEARMEMNSIMEEPESEYVREEELLPYEEPALMRQEQDNQATRMRSCPGVSYEGKCYEFFRGPKKAVDAEFFCQQHFHGGHLASITSRNIHAKIMNMMRQQYGRYTRTWVGGLRYLDSGRFVWLDGSRWTYADWLSGEPNNTSNLEDCIEVLPNGKFNDFTCWEPQAFICSYPQ